MVDAATILTSAGVAGTVTLLVEYAAKPHLEARKERILDRHRRRRETIARIGDVALAAEVAEREKRLAKPGYPLIGEIQPEPKKAFGALRASGENLRTATRLDEKLGEVDRIALEHLSQTAVSLGRVHDLEEEWSDASVLKVFDAMRSNLGRRRLGRFTVGSPSKVRAERRTIEGWLEMMRARTVGSRTPVTTSIREGADPVTTYGTPKPPPPYSIE